MKTFLYILGGLCALTEISMFIRVSSGLEQFTAFYVSIMAIIAYIGFVCFRKASNAIVATTPAQTKNKEVGGGITGSSIKQTLKASPIEKKQNDYLIDSGLDKKVLGTDSITLYLDILEDETISKEMRFLIEGFLMPYRISFIKYGFNTEFYKMPGFMKTAFEKDESLLLEEDYKYVSPTLKFLCKNTHYKIRAYPEFFFIAFPDVVYWALETEMLKVNQMLSFYTNEELKTDGYASNDIIKKIINLYLTSTDKELECRIIDHMQVL